MANSKDKISYLLSIESEENAHMTVGIHMRDVGLMPKKFLWTSKNVLYYIGTEADAEPSELAAAITKAAQAISAEGISGVIMFLEEAHKSPTECGTRWHCWHDGSHSSLWDYDGELYASDLPLRDLLLDMCDHPERYSEA